MHGKASDWNSEALASSFQRKTAIGRGLFILFFLVSFQGFIQEAADGFVSGRNAVFVSIIVYALQQLFIDD
ncbi:MAG: hypothetical protein K9L59_10155 [Desulfobacterales bacterium]|nr:hypothetical protein [Desulfobacterales bacterium]